MACRYTLLLIGVITFGKTSPTLPRHQIISDAAGG